MDIETLLYEEESTLLDFKQESYKFVGASKHEKSELLKDILAFANAWRREDAFILLGIEEVKGGRSMPVGIADELDDAQLQEFINKKTQRPITFTYSTHRIDNVKIGIIRIPLQQRPIYLTNDYGKLKQNIVYIRRGSSTDQAPPDEVFTMAKAELEDKIEAPSLTFEFADKENEKLFGEKLVISPIILDMSKYNEIGDFEGNTVKNKMDTLLSQHVLMIEPFRKTPRKEYYKELAFYEYIHNKTRQFSFAITNNSTVSVTDINIQINVKKNKDLYSLFEPQLLPELPESHVQTSIDPYMHLHTGIVQRLIRKKNTFDLEENEDAYRINVTFNKLKPKQTIYCDKDISIGALDSFDLNAQITIYADNLPEPIIKEIKIICQAKKQIKQFEGLIKEKQSKLVLSDLGITIKK